MGIMTKLGLKKAEEQPEIAAVSADYWTDHNVTAHKQFASAEESLDYLLYRNEMYPYSSELLPTSGADGLDVLDFGCGPGNDLVGFGHYSKPKRLVGVDVSSSSIAEASDRLALHGIEAELFCHDVQAAALPLAAGSFDLVRAFGVLQHMPRPEAGLAEIRRLLKPGGRFQVLVYNVDSIWLHLWVGYLRQIVDGEFPGLDKRDAFAKTTDGENCPFARCYTKAEWQAIVEPFGFKLKSFGAAIAAEEMKRLPARWDALQDQRLSRESRQFLAALRFDDRGIPTYNGVVAGVDGCYVFEAV
jgi:ubiquinone/menaquinone biosynthesis C-methylase UbiE